MFLSLSAARLGGLLRSAADEPSVSYGTPDRQPSLLPGPQLQDGGGSSNSAHAGCVSVACLRAVCQSAATVHACSFGRSPDAAGRCPHPAMEWLIGQRCPWLLGEALVQNPGVDVPVTLSSSMQTLQPLCCWSALVLLVPLWSAPAAAAAWRVLCADRELTSALLRTCLSRYASSALPSFSGTMLNCLPAQRPVASVEQQRGFWCMFYTPDNARRPWNAPCWLLCTNSSYPSFSCRGRR